MCYPKRHSGDGLSVDETPCENPVYDPFCPLRRHHAQLSFPLTVTSTGFWKWTLSSLESGWRLDGTRRFTLHFLVCTKGITQDHLSMLRDEFSQDLILDVLFFTDCLSSVIDYWYSCTCSRGCTKREERVLFRYGYVSQIMNWQTTFSHIDPGDIPAKPTSLPAVNLFELCCGETLNW